MSKWINTKTGEQRDSTPPGIDKVFRDTVAQLVQDFTPSAEKAKDEGVTPQQWANEVLGGFEYAAAQDHGPSPWGLPKGAIVRLGYQASAEVVTRVWGLDASVTDIEPLPPGGR